MQLSQKLLFLACSVFLALYSVSGMNSDIDEFLAACRDGDVNVVASFLADDNFDPSVPDNAAIRLASFSGHVNIVKLLLADPRANLLLVITRLFAWIVKMDMLRLSNYS